jgi:hypothetical protein
MASLDPTVIAKYLPAQAAAMKPAGKPPVKKATVPPPPAPAAR